MMNLLSLALVVSSLAGAAVWAPRTPHHNHRRQHHVLEGQRIIVVEYERHVVEDEDGSSLHPPASSAVVGKLLYDAKEAASVLPSLDQGLSGPETGDAAENLAARVSETAGDLKEMAKAAAHKHAECAKETAHSVASVPRKAREKIDTAKEAVKGVPEKAKEKAKNVKEMAKEKAETAKETVKSAGNEAMEGLSGVGEKAKEKAENVKEMAKEKAETAKETVKSAGNEAMEGLSGVREKAKEKGKTAKEAVKSTASEAMEKAENAKEMAAEKAETMKKMAKEKAETAKETMECAANEAMESLSGISERAKEKAETAKEAAKSAGNEAAECLSSVVEKAKKKAETVKEGVKSDVKHAAESLSNVPEKAKEKAETVKEAVESLLDAPKKVREAIGKLTDTGLLKDVIGATKEGRAHFSANISRIKHKIIERESYELFVELRNDVMERIRRMQNLVYNIVVLVTTPEAARKAAAVVHLLGFAVAYGACIWVTFVSSHVLFWALPKQQFGMAQSKLYPVYFRVVAYGIGAMFLAYFFGWDLQSMTERVQGFNMLAMLGLVLVNMLILEPKATKVMHERMKIEKEEGRGRETEDMIIKPEITVKPTSSSSQPLPQNEQDAAKRRVAKLNHKLKRCNMYSSFVNILTLMGLTLHMVHLAYCLQQAC